VILVGAAAGTATALEIPRIQESNRARRDVNAACNSIHDAAVDVSAGQAPFGSAHDSAAAAARLRTKYQSFVDAIALVEQAAADPTTYDTPNASIQKIVAVCHNSTDGLTASMSHLRFAALVMQREQQAAAMRKQQVSDIEDTLANSLQAPQAADDAAQADANQVAAQWNAGLVATINNETSATQHATQVCQQQGFGTDACSQAIADEVGSYTSQSPTSYADALGRMSQDEQAESAARRAQAADYTAAATALAGVSYDATSRADAVNVESALLAVASDFDNSATALDAGNSAGSDQAIAQQRADFDRETVAQAALDSDLGISGAG
jgi:hypothetical protein